MASKKQSTGYLETLHNTDVKLGSVLDMLEGKINLADYEGLYALEGFRDDLLHKFAPEYQALSSLIKRARDSVQDHKLDKDHSYAEIEKWAQTLRKALQIE